MEEILLRVAGVRAEMRGGKAVQPFVAGAAAGKIQFLQGALDPHIHRKRGVKAVAEQ